MYFFLTYLFLSTIKAIVITEIHRSAIYYPHSPCAFLGNASLLADASIQSCIWECADEDNCQTAVFYYDKKVCSMFAEFCKSGNIQSFGSVRASTICYRKNQEMNIMCSSTMTSNPAEAEKTTFASTTMSTVQSTTTAMTTITTTTDCGIVATACTSCTSSCSSGLLLSLNELSATAWGNGGTGFTTYSFTWIAPSTTSATIQFQFYTTTSGNYWDLDNVSVKDSSGTEKIVNGGFSTKSAWHETCNIGSCASVQNYGPSSSSVYLVTCSSPSNYYSVSQTFRTVTCATYNISFQIARYKILPDTGNAFVYLS